MPCWLLFLLARVGVAKRAGCFLGPCADSVLYILPLAAFGHVLFAIFFYSKQAKQPVPLVYYGALCVLMALVMHRISAELRTQSQRPIKEFAPRHDEDEEGDAFADEHTPKRAQTLAAHLDSLAELYVPPLSAQLLKAAWASKTRATAERVVSAPSADAEAIGGSAASSM